jgi:hypothetical protein
MSLPLLTYYGPWYSVSNTPSLADGVGTLGESYIIINSSFFTFGTVVEPVPDIYNIYDRDLGSGTKSWLANAYIYYDGAEWQMIGGAAGGAGTGTVTQVNTAGLISGGPITTTGTITTSMNTNKLVGRSTAGTGIMEEITVGSGLTLSGGTLTASGSGSGSAYEQQFLLMGA